MLQALERISSSSRFHKGTYSGHPARPGTGTSRSTLWLDSWPRGWTWIRLISYVWGHWPPTRTMCFWHWLSGETEVCLWFWHFRWQRCRMWLPERPHWPQWPDWLAVFVGDLSRSYSRLGWWRWCRWWCKPLARCFCGWGLLKSHPLCSDRFLIVWHVSIDEQLVPA